jgi:hypothetical protein
MDATDLPMLSSLTQQWFRMPSFWTTLFSRDESSRWLPRERMCQEWGEAVAVEAEVDSVVGSVADSGVAGLHTEDDAVTSRLTK